jgi:hypothetical protein
MDLCVTGRKEMSLIVTLISVNLIEQKRNEERISGAGLNFAWTDR